jgi:hypothetical protein
MHKIRLRGVLSMLLVFTLAAAYAGQALAGPGAHGEEKEVEGFTVELAFKDEEVRAGSSGVLVRLEGPGHSPVENAVIVLTVDRHAEEEDDHGESKSAEKDSHAEEKDSHAEEKGGHAEPNEFILKPGHNPGEYEGYVRFPSAGEWEVHVVFTVDGNERAVDFAVEVLPGSGPWLLLGTFFGVNTAVIAAAGIMRTSQNKKNGETS